MKNDNKSDRLAIIIPSLNGGGAERAAQTIGNYYSQRGYHVYYFLLEHTRRQSYQVCGKIVRLGINVNDSSLWKIMKYAFAIKQAKKKYRIDVAISLMEMSNFLNILSKGRERIVVSVRTTLTPWENYNDIFNNKIIIKILYNIADCVVAVSEYGKWDLARNYGILPHKIFVVPNPAIKHDDVIDKEWIFGDKTIVSLGRLGSEKQQDRMIRAFSFVKQNCKDAQLLFVGDGQLKRYLERVGRDLGLEKSIHFIGFTNAPGYYLKKSKVFVMASQVEGFPNAMVEAMAYGVPVVTTDSPGGCGEIVGKERSADEIQYCKYGILTPYICGRPKKNAPLDKEEIMLGQALLSVLNDEKVYAEYSEKSRQRAEYYSYQRVMEMWDAVLGLD